MRRRGVALAQRQAFFWLYIIPCSIAGGIWGAALISPTTMALIIVALGAGQIWIVRMQLIDLLFSWVAAPIISFSILAVGAVFALIGYAFVRTVLEKSLAAS